MTLDKPQAEGLDDESEVWRTTEITRHDAKPLIPPLPEDVLFTRDDLEMMPKDDVIDIVLSLQTRIRKPQTDQVTVQDVRGVAFDTGRITVTEYVRLPVPTSGGVGEETDATWKLRLIPSDIGQKPFALEIHDMVIIGRVTRVSTPDLDLTLHGGTVKGVSRRHAALRPTQEALYLIDLDSTNGTYRNGLRLAPDEPQRIQHDDTLSFGQLHFKLKIDDVPS